LFDTQIQQFHNYYVVIKYFIRFDKRLLNI